MGKINDNSARPPASKPKADPYAEAKKRDPKLDSYIKIRNNSDKSSTQWKEAQNSINAAYQKGPQRDATPSEDVTKGRAAEEAYAKKEAEKRQYELHKSSNKPPELVAAKQPPTTISSAAPAKALAVAEPIAALTGKAKRVLRRQTNKAKRKANRTSNSNSDAVAVSSKKAKEDAMMADIESDVKNRFGHGGKKSKRKMEGGFLEPPMDILFE